MKANEVHDVAAALAARWRSADTMAVVLAINAAGNGAPSLVAALAAGVAARLTDTERVQFALHLAAYAEGALAPIAAPSLALGGRG
jgi:hypothetical protein